MQILGSIPIESSIIIIVISAVIILFLIKYFYKIDIKTTEFKVVLYFLFSATSLTIVGMVFIGLFNSELLMAFIFIFPIIGFLIYSII